MRHQPFNEILSFDGQDEGTSLLRLSTAGWFATLQHSLSRERRREEGPWGF
jgi:hypothetical protein